MSEFDHWLAFSRWTPLAILADLDGTLIPFASTPDEARPMPEQLALLDELAKSPGVSLAVVSGRRRETLEGFFTETPNLYLVAEHGGWRRNKGAWEPAVVAEQAEVESVAEQLRRLSIRYPGSLVERKTWSVAFHFRAVERNLSDAAAVEVASLVHDWLAGHPSFHVLRGSKVFEVRPARMSKLGATNWLREQAGARARLLVLGDDVTDEDMFEGLPVEDESVIVGSERGRSTAARWELDSPEEANLFLAWLLGVRRGEGDLSQPVIPRRVRLVSEAPSKPERYGLLVISNRLPELRSAADAYDTKRRNVGGLVAALEPAMAARSGIWLGWSGRTAPRADPTRVGLDESATPKLAWVDLSEDLHRSYYNGFCNSALWPLLHSFPSRVRLSDSDWEAYRRANEAFARAAKRLVGPKQTIWIHDYHLFLLGARLRERGHVGPIGLFLHVPFPSPDLFFILPWAEELLAGLLALDLIGFHTRDYVDNFRRCAAMVPGTRVGDDVIEYRDRRTRIGAFPIGIIPEGFQEPPQPSAEQEVNQLMSSISPSRLVLGVDRLDYTKGIPERLMAFSRLIELFPDWRRNVCLVQISVPSRGDVPEYAAQRERIEQIVGRTNGEHGDGVWMPIRYLYRTFGRNQLSLLYRCAAVGYVTPLRDGMNLVAKEYVAAQNPEDPGVLVLSRFAGAATELTDALLVNPWHVDGLARDLDRSLRMGIDERKARHQKLLEQVRRTTALTWAEDFLTTLGRAGTA